MRRFFYCLLFLIPVLGLLFWTHPANQTLEITGTPTLHSNQLREDFRHDWVQHLGRAQKSITWAIYSLKDRHVTKALINAADRGVSVNVVFDPSACGALEKRLGPKIHCHRRKPQGLMHHKVLVVDDEICLGSTNATTASLRYHGNLAMRCQDAVLAKYLKEQVDSLHTSQAPRKNPFKAGELEFWWLPDPKGCDRLVELMEGAQKSIKVAMFTWTHPRLTEAVIQAHQRGLDVQVVLDGESAQGTSRLAYKALKEAGVTVRTSQGPGLLHHKWAWIDGTKLAQGSANWTRSAFTRNDDLFCIMDPLNKEQAELMRKLWTVCFSEGVE